MLLALEEGESLPLDNGQLTGPEGNNTTETGAYNLNGATSIAALMAVASPSHSGSTAPEYFLPTENERYKAAYYRGGGTNAGYWIYPTKSNNAPSHVLSATGTNNANYLINGSYTDPTNYLTPVGSFASSPNPYGTYDMGGDVAQWCETAQAGVQAYYCLGGRFDADSTHLASSYGGGGEPTVVADGFGFRVASTAAVPEPTTIALLLVGAVAFGIWRLRRKA